MEFTRGSNGGPALRYLEKSGAKWRKEEKDRKCFLTRHSIYVEMTRFIEKRVAEQDALAKLEDLYKLLPRKVLEFDIC